MALATRILLPARVSASHLLLCRSLSTTLSSSSSSPSPAHNPDGLTRYPSLSSPGGVLRLCDWIGTLSFASTGCATAASCGMDLYGSVLVGAITAVGGGTIRDALFLGRRPFWTEEPEYLYLCLLSAGLTFACWPQVEAWQKEQRQKNGSSSSPGVPDVVDKLVEATDCLGVGAFSVIGYQNGLRTLLPVPAALVCSVFTATGGGIVRDVLCRRPARVLHSRAEIYATAAMCGGMAYAAARKAGAGPGGRVVIGVGAAMAMRIMAVELDIKLPTWENDSNDGRGVAVRKEQGRIQQQK